MKFDVFHSLGRIDGLEPKRSERDLYRQFFEQLAAAEALGFGTMWVAESHFSSEVQKSHSHAVIPHYRGEVGLNADSMQLAQVVLARTQRLGFGTAIFNIVGGNGGPIAAADRVRSLAWLNSLSPVPRQLDIGVASGRFPYINRPFGVVPRDSVEEVLWPVYQSLIFLEALEIFLRLLAGETLSSAEVTPRWIDRSAFVQAEAFAQACAALEPLGFDLGREGRIAYRPRYSFEALRLVPELPLAECSDWLRLVLGSADPRARSEAQRWADMDLFNLSFTPPEQIDRTHAEMATLCREHGRQWQRSRMPRTVLVFLAGTDQQAAERASRCFDTYLEAMRGTAAVPDKQALMARALIGSSATVCSQLVSGGSRGFDADDRLMLWFEFNQTDGRAILRQMEQFATEVRPHL